jgi:bla regulator protein BlaR1
MTRLLACITLLVLAACVAPGQTAAPLAFEVATIKPADGVANGMRIGLSPGGLFTATNATLKDLIRLAYDVRDFQISGGPSWLSTERYDITAKVEGPGVSEDEIRKMPDAQRALAQDQYFQRLKALLADRFQLRLHRETRELPVYALIAAKNGPRMQVDGDGKEKGPNSGTRVSRTATGDTEIAVSGIPLAMFVNTISNQVGRTVLDKTGLNGDFTFKLTFAPDALQQAGAGDKGADRLSTGAGGPSIFTAIQEQLGLKLDSQKGPVEVVVIDGAQKASDN